MLLRDNEIGGGRMLRGMTVGATFLSAGTLLTREQVLAIPHTNRRCLVEQGRIGLFPLGAAEAAAPAEKLERMVVSRGFGKFDVVEGRVLASGVTKAQAHKMAGVDIEKH